MRAHPGYIWTKSDQQETNQKSANHGFRIRAACWGKIGHLFDKDHGHGERKHVQALPRNRDCSHSNVWPCAIAGQSPRSVRSFACRINWRRSLVFCIRLAKRLRSCELIRGFQRAEALITYHIDRARSRGCLGVWCIPVKLDTFVLPVVLAHLLKQGQNIIVHELIGKPPICSKSRWGAKLFTAVSGIEHDKGRRDVCGYAKAHPAML